MKRIKALANRWADDGEDFSCMDIKLHLGLDVCTTTIMNALTADGGVRWGIARANEGERRERHLQMLGVCVLRVMFTLVVHVRPESVESGTNRSFCCFEDFLKATEATVCSALQLHFTFCTSGGCMSLQGLPRGRYSTDSHPSRG